MPALCRHILAKILGLMFKQKVSHLGINEVFVNGF